MKKVIVGLLIVLLASATCYALTIKGITLSGQTIRATEAAPPVGADYVPATIEIREGADYAGTKYKVAIFSHTGAYTGTFICASNEMDIHVTMGTQSGTFTTEEELTPGGDYKIVVYTNGYIGFATSGNADTYPQGKDTSQTYSTFSSSLTGENYIYKGSIEFIVKNANGDTLLSWGDMTATSLMSVAANEQYFNQIAHECASLE
jgi:hypothetical protein